MTIQSIGGATSAWSTAGLQRPDPSQFRSQMKKSMDSIASSLGMKSEDLTKALQSGQSLKDVAASKGVSEDKLLATIKADLKANAPAGAPALSDTQIDNFAKRIAERSGGMGAPPSGSGAGSVGASQNTDFLQAITKALGTSSDDVVKSMFARGTFDSRA